MAGEIDVTRWIRIGAPIHAVALSGDGRHILVASDQELCLVDPFGHVRFRYRAPDSEESRFHLADMTAGMDVVLAAVRHGKLFCTDLETGKRGAPVWPVEGFLARGDLFDLSLSADGLLLAIGHLGPAVTVLNLKSLVDWIRDDERQRRAKVSFQDLLVWRQHPDDRNQTDAQVWAVALDAKGEVLYAGSSGPSSSILAALESRTGRPRGYLRPDGKVTRVAALDAPAGVVAVVTDGSYTHTLVCYSPQLDVRWQRSFDGHITALATNRSGGMVCVGSGWSGQIDLLDARTGEIVATYPALNSLNTCLAMADGRYLAAGTEEGHLAYLQFSAEEFRL